MSAFAQWLIGFVKSVIIWLYNNLVDFAQVAIDLFVDFILSVITIFPQGSDVPSMHDVLPSGPVWDFFLNSLNWLFPIGYLLDLSGFVLGAVLIYFTMAPLARWLKLLT